MELTENLKQEIKQSFYHCLDCKIEDITINDYRDLNYANEKAIESFDRKFSDYNNSWIDEDSDSFEKDKENIIEYLRTL